jgi:predicted lipid-binding transport protein (Tim44 family)
MDRDGARFRFHVNGPVSSMDEFFDIPTLIVIGIAIVVLFRLRQVLGTRIGRQRPPEAGSPAESPLEENVITGTARPVDPRGLDAEARQRKFDAEVEQLSHGDAAVAAGLKAIGEADPTFSPKPFLEGAKQAYEMILTAYAQGDRKTLKNLLEKDVYDGFDHAMTEREAAGHKVDFTFVGLPRIEISHAGVEKRNAVVAVQFHAEVVSVTRDKDDAIVEGSVGQVKQIADEWSFSRSPKSRDPNWKLVATNSLE